MKIKGLKMHLVDGPTKGLNQEGLNDESEIEPSRRMVINQPDEIKAPINSMTTFYSSTTVSVKANLAKQEDQKSDAFARKKVAMILLQDNALEDLVSNFKKTRQGRREVDLEAADTVANKRKLQWESELSNDIESTYMIGAVFVWLWLLLLSAGPF